MAAKRRLLSSTSKRKKLETQGCLKSSYHLGPCTLFMPSVIYVLKFPLFRSFKLVVVYKKVLLLSNWPQKSLPSAWLIVDFNKASHCFWGWRAQKSFVFSHPFRPPTPTGGGVCFCSARSSPFTPPLLVLAWAFFSLRHLFKSFQYSSLTFAHQLFTLTFVHNHQQSSSLRTLIPQFRTKL